MMRVEVARLGISAGAVPVLLLVVEGRPDLVLVEIAERLGITPSAASTAVGRLERDGFVRRVPGTSAGLRFKEVVPTEAGKALRGDLQEAQARCEEAFLAALPPADRNTLQELMNRLIAGTSQVIPQPRTCPGGPVPIRPAPS